MKITIQRPLVELKEPKPEEVRGWLDQSVGKYHRALLERMLEDLKDNWANGDYTGSTTEETIQLNSEALGKVQQIAEIIVTLDELSTDEEKEDEEVID